MSNYMNNFLDVTGLEPAQKFTALFTKFNLLNVGEDLTIQHNYDPKPLYYQLLGERGNVFTWEYLEEGPQWWRVRLLKKQSGDRYETLGDLVAKDFRKAAIFKKHGLDFCCGGKRTLNEACLLKGLDIEVIEKELSEVKVSNYNRLLQYNDWEIDFLSDYIVNTHHMYVNKTLPDLLYYAGKVSKAHGKNHPELLPVHNLIKDVYTEMEAHMMKEEHVLFPYIKQLVRAHDHIDQPGFGNIINPINIMEMEHEMVGSKLETISTLTKNYVAPPDACTSYILFYQILKEFEADLHLHVHLENNILFPKAIELERKLMEKSFIN